MPKLQDALATVAAKQQLSLFGTVPLAALPRLPGSAARRLPANAQTVCIFAFPYFAGDFPHRNLSLYTLGRDYHPIVTDILTEMAQELALQFAPFIFTPFADISPIGEVQAAVQAGLGVLGQNGLCITAQYGSYIFLGEVITDMPAEIAGIAPNPQPCKGCGGCKAACPHGALLKTPLCTDLCLSHITQKKGVLSPSDAAKIAHGGMVWGCDLCQAVCPHNKDCSQTPIRAFKGDIIPLATPETIPTLAKHHACGWRGQAVLRRNLALLQTQK